MKGIRGPHPAANKEFMARGEGVYFEGETPAMFSRIEVSACMFFMR